MITTLIDKTSKRTRTSYSLYKVSKILKASKNFGKKQKTRGTRKKLLKLQLS